MKTSLPRRTLVLLPFACAALYGCPQQEEAPENAEYADVIYVGDATDEAMVALGSSLDQRAPGDDPARAPQLDLPAATELPKSPIPTFQWHFGPQVSFSAAPVTVPPMGLALARPVAVEPSWPYALGELLGPPRAAHAHGDPLNGPATLLVFSTEADPKLVRVLTDQTSYQPAQEAWDKLVAAKASITLSLVGAEFENNRIAGGGEPVQGSKLVFTITP